MFYSVGDCDFPVSLSLLGDCFRLATHKKAFVRIIS